MTIILKGKREGILTTAAKQITCISDQQINTGDTVYDPGRTTIKDGKALAFSVTEVTEERDSRGDWNDAPPIWRSMQVERVMIQVK